MLRPLLVVRVQPAVAVVAGVEACDLDAARSEIRQQDRADVAFGAGNENFHVVDLGEILIERVYASDRRSGCAPCLLPFRAMFAQALRMRR